FLSCLLLHPRPLALPVIRCWAQHKTAALECCGAGARSWTEAPWRLPRHFPFARSAARSWIKAGAAEIRHPRGSFRILLLCRSRLSVVRSADVHQATHRKLHGRCITLDRVG